MVDFDAAKASTILPATDDATTSPSGLTYHVTIRNQSRVVETYDIELSHLTNPVNFADIVPSLAQAANTYVLASLYNALLTALDLQVKIVDGDAFVQDNIWPPGVQVPVRHDDHHVVGSAGHGAGWGGTHHRRESRRHVDRHDHGCRRCDQRHGNGLAGRHGGSGHSIRHHRYWQQHGGRGRHG